MEGTQFDTDEENLTAWHQCFQQHHCWVRDAGPAVLVGISSTRFRSNAFAHHEVYVDEQQLEWLRGVLETLEPEKPVVVFSHAPPMGCGLKVINRLHVKNRCVLCMFLLDVTRALQVPVDHSVSCSVVVGELGLPPDMSHDVLSQHVPKSLCYCQCMVADVPG